VPMATLRGEMGRCLDDQCASVITYWFMAIYWRPRLQRFCGCRHRRCCWGTAIQHAWTGADQALCPGAELLVPGADGLTVCGRD
jgi:hypothetical protein